MRRAATFGALLLAGCTVGPNYQRPELSVAAEFAEAAPGALSSDAELACWWKAFGDPQLDELVDRALAQNLDVETAAARISEARARERVAGAADEPQVAAQASVTRQRISENAIPVPPGTGGQQGGAFGLPGSEFTTWRPGFDASWEIDLFGKTRRSLEAARARTNAATWNRRAVQVSVTSEVATTYFELRTLQARIANADAELARRKRFEQMVAARVRGGLVSGQDLEQQASEVSVAKAALEGLQGQAEVQVHALGVLTGDSPESLIAELSAPKALPAVPAIPPGLPSDLLRRRPDIRSAERELAASTADIGVAVADLYPRFSLTAAPALVSTALGSLLEWGSRSFSIGAALSWPVFNGGRTRGNIAVASARQEQALIAYRETVLRALQDVEDSLSRTDADRKQLAALEDSLGRAGRAEEIARTRYGGGLVTYSDVLVAQARRLSLEAQVIDTKGSLARDSAALFKAMGGGWPEIALPGATQ
jgi:NodT family efflux transporter outer membrane factor (OMF) lipoprotein